MAEETKVETMEDYAAELEASFKKVRTGDNLTGVIIDVTDEKIVGSNQRDKGETGHSDS